MDTTTGLIATFVLLFSLVSRRLESTAITAPIVFVTLGMVFGPSGLDLVRVGVNAESFHLLAEFTLIFVLFGDASRIDLRVLRRELGLPVRLLAVGMPLTIAAGAGLAKWAFPALSWAEAGVLGAVLAPTDAALGQAVVSSPKLPVRIRQALNVESGLNDGIAVPVVLIFAALASVDLAQQHSASEWLWFAGKQVTLGPLVGFVVSLVFSRFIRLADSKGWMQATFQRLSGVALALLAYACAEAVGGNGFIAAFVAGLTLGNTARGQCAWLHEFLEAEGQLLMLLVFLLFGASMAWPALQGADLRVFVYVALSLTVVRMFPVALALVRTRLQWPSVLFLGWFGPRGLATVIFGLIILSEFELPHIQTVLEVAMATVVASVFAHGLTAVPFTNLYARSLGRATAEAGEMEEVSEQPLRAGMPLN